MARRLPIVEFIALMAMLFSMVAFSIDAMLPGLPDIAADLASGNPNSAQLVITSFMLGMGIGTLFSGPLADSYGRRIVVLAGIGIFIVGALLAFYSTSLEMLLAARFLQGIGVAGPRIAPLAIVRDLYEGRRMAQITSFVTTVFMLVPAAAPSVGALIINQWDWRAIFVSFAIFGAVGALWFALRQDETLAYEDRRPFRPTILWAAFKEVVTNRLVMIYTVVITLSFATLIGLLSSTQQIYTETFGRGDSFPLWFGLTALIAAPGTVLNGMLVLRLGMRRLVIRAFGAQLLVSVLAYVIFGLGFVQWEQSFALWYIWSSAFLFCIGMILGNLNALVLQPLGHIAGMASSVIIAISTVLAVFIGGPIGLAFDGTPLPLIGSVAILTGIAWVMMIRVTREDPPQD